MALPDSTFQNFRGENAPGLPLRHSSRPRVGQTNVCPLKISWPIRLWICPTGDFSVVSFFIVLLCSCITLVRHNTFGSHCKINITQVRGKIRDIFASKLENVNTIPSGTKEKRNDISM